MAPVTNSSCPVNVVSPGKPPKTTRNRSRQCEIPLVPEQRREPGLVSLVGISLCMTDFTSLNLDSSANVQGAGGDVPPALTEI